MAALHASEGAEHSGHEVDAARRDCDSGPDPTRQVVEEIQRCADNLALSLGAGESGCAIAALYAVVTKVGMHRPDDFHIRGGRR